MMNEKLAATLASKSWMGQPDIYQQIRESLTEFTSCTYIPINQLACLTLGLFGSIYLTKTARQLYQDWSRLFPRSVWNASPPQGESQESYFRRYMAETEELQDQRDIILLKLAGATFCIVASKLFWEKIPFDC